ncbi:MAG: NAD(P)H-dependent oxidoreductase [Bacteroidales bacterium]|nr:NAD(P)H-dependent oxidoreductase [Candidatus Sodaliphilus fimicaballi]
MESSIKSILEMKNYLSLFSGVVIAFMMMVCQCEVANAAASDNKTLIVYYSYTNNTEQIVDDLKTLVKADVIEVEPVNKSLDYAANGYAIGTEQLNKIKANPNDESSYPAIDPVTVDMTKYNTVIIATPLWWSQMASNMQTFLFKYGKEMVGKNIGLIVSSHSSGISGVEADAKRLVPNGKFFAKSLWINASKHSQRKALLEQWLKDINYNENANGNTMKLQVNNSTLKVKLADNAATKALLERLKEGAITYNAHDYGGFEKVGALGFSLPSNDTFITTEAGDIMLYTSNQLCIFFDSNSWDYTPIGKIEGMTKQQLKDAFGTGEVSITLSLDNSAGITSVTVNQAKATGIYTLTGQKVSEIPEKGIYIENGVKKVRK